MEAAIINELNTEIFFFKDECRKKNERERERVIKTENVFGFGMPFGVGAKRRSSIS